MKTVGRLGSYITKGVYSVSGSLHPFGGAVDIIVVQQPDGSFKSSPWYVRFGKFQGVLKANDKVVKIGVNGVEADFHMYLDPRGEAYFLREVEEGEPVVSPPSSRFETDPGPLKVLRPVRPEGYNSDSSLPNSGSRDDATDAKKIVVRSTSRRSKIMGIVFGRRSASTKDDCFQEVVSGTGIPRMSSLERAEIAADLLELHWSTNLATSKSKKGSRLPPFSSPDRSDGNLQVDSSVRASSKEQTEYPILAEVVVEASGNEFPTISSNSSKTSLQKTDDYGSRGISGAMINHEMQRLGPGKLCEGNELGKQHTCGETDIAPPGSGTPGMDNGSNKVHSFIHWEASQGLEVELDGLKEQHHETLYYPGAEREEVIAYSQSETLHITSQLLQEDTVNQQTVNFGWMADEGLNLEMTEAALDSDTPAATFTLKHPSVEAAESCSIKNTSSHGNLSNQIEEEKYKFEHGVVSGGGIKPGLDLRSEIVSSAPVSENSEEEDLLFGDLDEFRPNRVLDGSESPNSMYIERTREVNGPSVELLSSSEKIVKRNAFGLETEPASSPINVRGICSVSGSEAGYLAESMPNISSQNDSLDTGLRKSSSYSLDLTSKPVEWTLCQDDSGSSHVDSGNVNQAVREHSSGEDLGIKNRDAVPSSICRYVPWSDVPKYSIHLAKQASFWHGRLVIKVGDPSKEPVSPKQLGSRRTSQTALNALDIASVEHLNSTENDGMNAEKDTLKAKVAKKLARVNTPTSEQLASLNLQEGKNIVTFTFSTPMLGKQEVDARIFLWKWNTRVVISDVDGTITKSDVLGQFMPLVGVDWSQTGVANLFSAIQENGYQLLFLSARAITQAYLTRRFLCSLKQDGKTLPEGPVVISPDGLFPSLFREVIRRAPHEFKIACLEDIKALFPSDCQPFYAGFGNRDTDEISYVKVGIPKGKIFIINPKGEVSVHRRVDRKSYHSLHDLVHGMFPSTLTFEQEDYNSWNYWKLPSLFSDV